MNYRYLSNEDLKLIIFNSMDKEQKERCKEILKERELSGEKGPTYTGSRITFRIKIVSYLNDGRKNIQYFGGFQEINTDLAQRRLFTMGAKEKAKTYKDIKDAAFDLMDIKPNAMTAVLLVASEK